MAIKSRLARRAVAEGTAALVLRDLNISSLRVDPKDIAAQKDIVVQPKPDLHDGVSGMLVMVRDVFGIMYATKIKNVGFQNFSIAHELGHYFIDGHCDALLTAGVHSSRAGFASADPYEQEADFFAAALLMPEGPFRRELNKHPAGLYVIKHLSDACETSLSATGIRYSSLTRDAVAVIASTGPAIDYCFLSDGMKEAKGLSWLRKGSPVPSGSATFTFNADADNIRLGREETGEGLLNDWMGGERRYAIREQVIGLGEYGRTLTVLSCDQLGEVDDPDSDESDEDLIESWTPKFRR
ncbi:ImmA/IrrE family metallo-endopeptidase [Methylobacterium oryzae]|uniref:ImmA/IrrE family metallo-endopeptidase n=1 Tax=Methylobacterium oryzae TaxID=334852 RepID=UPI001F2BC626|nr:ImmA/IrrE family metallo-endopeptidase [Methylobacterium oryzae]UIN38456.1 ImmA/IrrE family metallo-endopeptidase [Methylobacterium oryzae]